MLLLCVIVGDNAIVLGFVLYIFLDFWIVGFCFCFLRQLSLCSLGWVQTLWSPDLLPQPPSSRWIQLNLVMGVHGFCLHTNFLMVPETESKCTEYVHLFHLKWNEKNKASSIWVPAVLAECQAPACAKRFSCLSFCYIPLPWWLIKTKQWLKDFFFIFYFF